jgi:hypothetical protein
VFSTPLLPHAAANSVATVVANSRGLARRTSGSIQSAVQPAPMHSIRAERAARRTNA